MRNFYQIFWCFCEVSKRHLLAFSAILLFMLVGGNAFSQAIIKPDISRFNPSGLTFGPEGLLSVPIQTTGCFNSDNKFKLTIYNDTKTYVLTSLASVEPAHFATFVNERLPADVVTGNYKIKVESTSPAVTSGEFSQTIFIDGAAKANESEINVSEEMGRVLIPSKVFGLCKGVNGYEFLFRNKFPDSEVSVRVFNDLTGEELTSFTFDNSNLKTLKLADSYFTMEVTAKKNNITSIRSYIILNSPVDYSLTTQLDPNLCFPQSYFTRANISEKAYPGLLYRVTWGDGDAEVYTQCQILKKNNGGVPLPLEHPYKKTSCGNNVTSSSGKIFKNAFQPELTVVSDFYSACEATPAQVIVRVSQKPRPEMDGKTQYCVGDKISLTGSPTTPGSVPGDNDCSGGMIFEWYISKDKDNFPTVPQEKTTAFSNFQFTEAGRYYVKMVAKNEIKTDCFDFIIKEVCVSEPAKFDFNLPSGTCQNQTLTLRNEIENASKICDITYRWEIKDPTGFTHTVFPANADLSYKFEKIGDYEVSLSMGVKDLACDKQEIKKKITISEAGAAANFSKQLVTKCAAGFVDFAPGLSNPDHSTYYTGDTGSATFNWTITPFTGGEFEFVGGTSSSSQYPKIEFKQAGTYTVTVTYVNPCGNSTATQTLNLGSPLINRITFDDNSIIQTICNGAIPRKIVGQQTLGFPYKYQWYRSTNNSNYVPVGGETSDPDYQPPVATGANVYYKREIINGSCKVMSDYVWLRVNTKPTVSNIEDRIYCSGAETGIFSFLGADQSNPVYSWTNSNPAIGLAASGTGNIPRFTALNPGNVPLVATITVTLSQTQNGLTCAGDPKTFKITVLPALALENIPNKSVCGGMRVEEFFPVILNRDINDGAKVVYDWTVIQGDGINLATSGTGNSIPAFETNNDGSSDKIAKIKVLAYYEFSGKSCLIGGSEYTLTIKPLTAAKAGNDALIATTSYKLSGNAPKSGEAGKWTQLSGDAVIFDNANHNTATVSGLNKGKHYKFEWAIDNGICSSTSVVLVSVLSDIGVSIYPDKTGSLCPATPVKLAIATLAGGDVPTVPIAPEYTYEWQYSTDNIIFNSLSIYTKDDIIVKPLITTYYRLKVRSHDLVEAYSPSVEVKVFKQITNNLIQTDQTICADGTPDLLKQHAGHALTNGAGGVFSYLWEKKGISEAGWTRISNATDVTYQPGPLSETTEFRRIVFESSCIDTRSESNIIKVTVNPRPRAEYTASKQSGCAPFNLASVISSADQYPELNNSYEWYAGTQHIGSGPAFPGYIIIASGVSVDIKLEVTSKNGCSNATLIKTFNTPRNDLLPKFSLNKLQACGASAVTFTNISKYSTGEVLSGVSYSWTVNDVEFSTVASPSPITLQPNADHTDAKYKITLKISNGCIEKTHTDSVIIRTTPLSMFSPERKEGCSPFLLKVTNQSRGIDPGKAATNKFTFDFGDGSAPLVKFDNSPVEHLYPDLPVAKTYTVKLKAENDCGFHESSYTIKVLPNTISSDLVVVNSNSGCVPFNVQFDNNTSGATSFTLNFGDGESVSGTVMPQRIAHTYKTDGIYTATLSVSNECSSLPIVSTEIITVYKKPAAHFSVDTKACIGNELIFTNNKIVDGVTYQWDFGDGQLSNSQQQTVKHTFLNPGNFTVRLTATRISNGVYCSEVFFQTVEVSDKFPLAAFSTSRVADCAPFIVSITNNSQNAEFYRWYLDDVLVSNDKVPVIKMENPGQTYKLRLEVGNSYSCENSQSKSVNHILTTYPKPIAKFELMDEISCTGSLDLKLKSNQTTGATKLTWDYGNGVTYLGNSPSYTYSPGKYTLRLIAENSNGCKDVVSKEIAVYKPLEAVIFPDKTTGCTKITVNFQSSLVNHSGFRWDFGDGVTGGSRIETNDENPTRTFTYHKSPYTVTLTAYNENCNLISEVITVNVSAPPKPRFDALPDTAISPLHTFTFRNLTNDPSLKYRWLFGDGKSSDEEHPPPHTYEKIGSYKVRLIAINDEECRDTITKTVVIKSIPGYLYVPNAFEPGNLNRELQVFKPKGLRLEKYTMRIFNRWGEVVWQSSQLDSEGAPVQGWDGTMKGMPAPQGVYVWDISAVFKDGTEWKGMKYENGSPRKSGPIHLMR